MDSPKHWLPVTKTSTSRRHWLLTIPKFWNSLVMDESGCKGFGQVLWERERGQLKSIWKNELLCFSLPNDWRSHIIERHGFEREDEIISSPHFSSSIYILLKTHLPIHIPNPSLSLSYAFLQLHCQPLDSCLVTRQHHPSPSFIPLLENPVSLGLIQVVSKATQSCPPLTSHWIRLFMGQHHPICLFHSTSWNPLFLGTRLSHLQSDSVLNTSGPMTWQIQLDTSKLNPCWKNLLFFPSLILGLNICTTWWQPC